MSRMYLAPIKEGMYLSDEPGFYKPGEFGIRIESDLVVCAAETRYGFGAPDAALASGSFSSATGRLTPGVSAPAGAREWLKFEYLTKVPFCRALIDTAMLSPAEREWIDEFHAGVRATLLPLVPAGGAALAAYIEAETAPL
eukprot:COSAG04_NODE_1560_length_6343_cov_3.386131_3_plen_141_part_00